MATVTLLTNVTRQTAIDALNALSATETFRLGANVVPAQGESTPDPDDGAWRLVLQVPDQFVTLNSSVERTTLICGNPVDGFECYGVFDSAEEAIEHANRDPELPVEWHTMKIHGLD